MSTEPSMTILGGTGPVGRHVARSAIDAGWNVMIGSRNMAKLEMLEKDLGPRSSSVQIDITSGRAQLARLTQSCDVVVVAAGGDPSNLESQVEIANAVVRTRPERLLYLSSCWSFAPVETRVLTESHPRRGFGKAIFRREAEDIVMSAGGIVCHLPDFFGPYVHTSPLQRIIQMVTSGGLATWVAAENVVREHAFIADIGEVVVRSAVGAPGGENFILPGSGPITFTGMVDETSLAIGRRAQSKSLGSMSLDEVRRVDQWWGHLGDSLGEYRKAVEYDASRLEKYIGPIEVTAYRTGIEKTVEWIGER